jgi:uncharacterized membrane protein YqhA
MSTEPMGTEPPSPEASSPEASSPEPSRPQPTGPETNVRPGGMAGTLEAGVERSLAASLRLVIIPVVILALAALGAFAYGAAVFVHSVGSIIHHPFPVGHNIGLFLLDVDLMLIGATLLISAVGLYKLFIRDIPAEGLTRMPDWLEMRDLNDLKARVVAMVVLVLAVTFVEVAVDLPSGLQLLELGGGVAVVIAALTFFLRVTDRTRDRGLTAGTGSARSASNPAGW